MKNNVKNLIIIYSSFLILCIIHFFIVSHYIHRWYLDLISYLGLIVVPICLVILFLNNLKKLNWLKNITKPLLSYLELILIVFLGFTIATYFNDFIHERGLVRAMMGWIVVKFLIVGFVIYLILILTKKTIQNLL